MTGADINAAAAAIDRGELVVYPTETVYGLGANALDPTAVERVFTVKGRSHDNPLSIGVPDVERAARYAHLSDRDRAFIERFLPGPVTVVCERRSPLPSLLTAGRDRVGIRIPDHSLALELLEATSPITATSANRSGAGSVTDPTELAPSLRDAVAVIIDDGHTPGTESTVVDPTRGVIHRRGAHADAVETWLAEH